MLLSSDAKRAVLRQDAQTGQTQRRAAARTVQVGTTHVKFMVVRACKSDSAAATYRPSQYMCMHMHMHMHMYMCMCISTLLQVDSAAAATVLLVPLSQTLNVCSTFTRGVKSLAHPEKHGK